MPFIASAEKLKSLIVDGQNNHAVWPKSTIMMRQYLEETGLFEVDIARTQFTWRGEREAQWMDKAGVGPKQNLANPKMDLTFAPDFSLY